MKQKTKRKGLAVLCIAAGLFLLLGCAKPGSEPITSLEQLGEAGRKIGVQGDMMEFDMLKRDYPNAEVLAYNDCTAAYEDVAKGRLDAFVYARREMEFALANGTKGVRLLDENYSVNTVAVGISPKAAVTDLQGRINAFLAECRADGTLDDMYLRWVINGDETMPDIAVPENPSTHLRVGTAGTALPYSYFAGTELAGYDIELAYRFAAWLNADVEFKIYDFGGIVAAAQSGDVDCIMSNLYITPEKAEAIPFSDPLFDVEITAMVRDDGTAQGSASGTVRWQDYNGKKLGVLVGPLMEDAAKAFFPDSEYLLFDSYPDCVTALLAGKIDGFLGDEPGVKSIRAEQPKVDYIHESLTENNYSFAFRKDDQKSAALCREFNAFLKKCWEDGTMEELDVWFGVDEAKKTVDMSGLSGENGTIRVVTTSTDMPWSYIKDGKHVGYDIDLVVRFCRDRGYALEIGDVDFAGRIPAIQSGKYDFTTDMNVTPERMEQVLFSDPTSHGGIVLAVRASDLAASIQPESAAEYSEYSDLSGKRVSMLTGAPFEELVRSKVPDVGEFSYFNSAPDTILALKSGKTDAFLTNNAVGALAVNRNPELALFPQDLDTSAFGIAFAKGDPARDMWQAAYDAISEETKNALWEKWTGSDDSVKLLPEQDWPGSNGTVQAAVCDSLEPMSYMGNGGQLIGFDIEMILLMAKELDVHVEFTGMEFSAIMSSVQAGKALLGAGSIIATDERKQSVDFVEYYPAAFVLVVRAFRIETGGSFLSAIADSFQKTFIRENRWKLFLKGIGTTMLITVLSVLFGTILGFAVFMLCRNGNPAANFITRFFVWLVQGMPAVVLLMILYYIIFGRVNISGAAVSVVGFTLVFGSAVFGMLRVGVGAIDKGQLEAAYTLGYTNRKAFFRIILPQALPHFMPAYKGEITALIKATAVVGYVAVQDLTKMGDIVRSRTYEAFFPLIAVAIIYFILAAILTFLVNRIEIRIDPRRRSKQQILKGVKTDD
ncbi:MAG: transporter substrate-binding domain-containing protein [Clostridia bacterium]|nr:transporter substrate-binding domain-containing protein [Clostridia bacterium]MBQ6236354.1 transporter substrate-binding domain-containing protein [Clostridia bacterium]